MHFPADDLPADRRAMLFDIVPEVGQAGFRAHHQHFGDAGQRVADLGLVLMLGAHAAAMLARVMRMRLDLLRLDVLGVELQDLRALVVDPGHGAIRGHVLRRTVVLLSVSLIY